MPILDDAHTDQRGMSTQDLAACAWVGFGRDFDVNTGPWELIQREHGTDKAKDYATIPAE